MVAEPGGSAMSGDRARMPIEDAMRLFFGHLFSRLPAEIGDELLRQFLDHAKPKQAGMMWWADQPLTVFEENGQLVVDRAAVDAIVSTVTPAELPSSVSATGERNGAKGE